MESLRKFLFRVFLSIFIYLFIDNYLAALIKPLSKIWNFLFHLILLPTVKGAALLAKALGHQVTVNYNHIAKIDTAGIFVNNSSLAVGLAYSFAILILFYPGGDNKKKIWFIPAGVLLIFFSSILRLTYYVVNYQSTGQMLTAEQHAIFNIIMLTVIFLLWLIWVRLVNKLEFIQ